MTRVALISLYNFDDLGIRTLHSLLDENGHDVHSVFLKDVSVNQMEPISDADIMALRKVISEIRPELIGIKVGSSFFPDAKRITQQLKPVAPIVWGGIHPTLCPEECIEEADMICLGEGEHAILELANTLGKGDITRIRNLWLKVGRKVYRNEIRPLIENLDDIPFPTFSGSKQYYIDKGLTARNISETASGIEWIMSNGVYPIMTSRGCFFSCTYCCNNLLRKAYQGKGSYVRRRSVKNVIEELSLAKKSYGIKSVFFHDDIFTFDGKWISSFCREYRKRIGLPFEIMIHPRFSDARHLSMLRDAGLVGVKMGIQTGSSRIREEVFNRHENNREILEADSRIHDLGLKVMYDIIIDNPQESDEDRRATLRLLTSLRRPFRANLYSLIHFPGYTLTENLLREGHIDENDVENVKQKVFENWQINLSKTKSSWNHLIWLSQVEIVPKRLINFMSRRGFVMKRSRLLMYATMLTYALYYKHADRLFLRRFFSCLRPAYSDKQTRLTETKGGPS